MKELLLYIAKNLVDDPDAVTVTKSIRKRNCFELRVAETIWQVIRPGQNCEILTLFS